MIKTDSSLIIATSVKANQWCVYEHLAQFEPGKPPEVVFVNACKVLNVYRMTEGRRNTEWQRMFSGGAQIQVRIVAVTDDKYEAIRYIAKHVATLPELPRCNLRGVSTKGVARPILCSNGKTYKTQTDAADDLGIHASAISRHIRGYGRTVNGYTFEFSNGAAQ